MKTKKQMFKIMNIQDKQHKISKEKIIPHLLILMNQKKICLNFLLK